MTRAQLALVLAGCVAGLADCGPASSQQIEKAAAEVRAKVNAYCDARQKALDALGIAGSAAAGLGDAGAAP